MLRAALCTFSALALGLGIGWRAGPGPVHHYCDGCARIVALQGRSDLMAVDRAEIKRLKAVLSRNQIGERECARSMGEAPDLHPDCECMCHRFWLAGAEDVHAGAIDGLPVP